MRPARHLDIGPLRFALRTELAGAVRYSDPAYGGFFSGPVAVPALEHMNISRESRIQPGRGRPGSKQPRITSLEPPTTPSGGVGGYRVSQTALIELPVDVVPGAVAVPAEPPLWQAGGHWAAWEDGAELVFHVGLQAPDSRRSSCRVARDLSRAELAVHPAAWMEDGVLESPLRYPLDQILSWGLLSRIGGALMHAAVAVKDGVGWVFTCRSGAGKSTISSLLLAEGYRILNDDRAMVFRRGGEWRVAGTPWHGSGRFAEADEAPLGGIYFLQKAAGCRAESMSAAQARLALLDVAAVPWFAEDWSQGVLDGLDRLAREIEIRRFHFTKTPEAVRALAGEAVLA